MKKHCLIASILALTLYLAFCTVTVFPQSTEFSYQGFITDTTAPANGTYDIEFRLFDALNGGVALATLPRANVLVTNGVFSVVLDFGPFPGTDRFLEIGVRPAGSSSFTTLAPRSKILAVPYATLAQNALNAQAATSAIDAQNAVNATNAQNAVNAQNAQTSQNALNLGGTAANQFVLTGDARLSDARNPLPNSPSYIQNSSNQQAASNFNISGNGTAGGTLTGNIVSATTQFNIGLSRVLASPGSFNFFAGVGAGQLNSTGTSNTLLGVNAGIFNTTGSSNTFAGFEAGRNNNAGNNNSYFGKDAGRSSTTGNDNSFFGHDAGQSNTTGSSNSFFGKGAGADNTTATGNSFFGFEAGTSNTTGGNNAFFGFEAGRLSETAFNNSFFGYEAGESNVIGLNNSFFGFLAGKLNTGSRNSFFGSGAGQSTTGAFHNTFIGGGAGSANTTGDDSTFLGMDAGNVNTTGSGNTALGTYANFAANNLTNATAIGYKAFVGRSNALVLGSIAGVNDATEMTDVGIGVTDPARRLDVNGIVRVGATTGTLGCIEDRDGTVIAGTCASDLRFKKNITPFGSVLSNFSKLRPVNYFWRTEEFADQRFGRSQSYGLIAQEVEEIFPELVSTDEKGYKAVNYSKLPLLTIQAVREQQAQIEEQKKQIAEQRSAIEALQRKLDEFIKNSKKQK